MTDPFGILVLIVAVALYCFLYRFSLSKIGAKRLFLVGLGFAVVPLAYFFLLGALGESLMPCSLVPSSLAGMEPLFLRDLIGALVGVSPLLGLFSGIAIFRKERLYAVGIIALSIVGIVATSVFDICIQF